MGGEGELLRRNKWTVQYAGQTQNMLIQLSLWQKHRFVNQLTRPFKCNTRQMILFRSHQIPRGLVVRIRRSHRRGPGSIPGVGMLSFFCPLLAITGAEGEIHLPEVLRFHLTIGVEKMFFFFRGGGGGGGGGGGVVKVTSCIRC